MARAPGEAPYVIFDFTGGKPNQLFDRNTRKCQNVSGPHASPRSLPEAPTCLHRALRGASREPLAAPKNLLTLPPRTPYMGGPESQRFGFVSNPPASSSPSSVRGCPIGKLARIGHHRVVVAVAVVVVFVVIVDVVGSRASGSSQNPDRIWARTDSEQLHLDGGPQTCTGVQTGGAGNGRRRDGGPGARGPRESPRKKFTQTPTPWVIPRECDARPRKGARGGPRPALARGEGTAPARATNGQTRGRRSGVGA